MPSQFFLLFDIYGNNAFQWGQAHNLDRRTFLRRERKRAVTEARNRMYAAQRREAVTKLLLVTKSLAGIVLAYCPSLALVLIYVTGSQRERLLFYEPPKDGEERRHKRKLYLGISEVCPPPRRVRTFYTCVPYRC